MDRSQVVLGIDPGTTGMGYAFLDVSRDPPSILDRGIIATVSGSTGAEKLLAIAEALDSLIGTYRPSSLAVERLYFNRNVRTAMAVAEARGIALLCAVRGGLAVAEYTPQEVKLAVTGNGAADKGQVQRMLALLLPLESVATQDNVADAIAIALTHAHRERLAAAIAKAT